MITQHRLSGAIHNGRVVSHIRHYHDHRTVWKDVYYSNRRLFSTYSPFFKRDISSSQTHWQHRNESKGPKLDKSPDSASDSTNSQIIDVSKYANLRDDYQMPKYPIILCHGFSGFDKLITIPSLKLKDWFTSGPNKTDTELAKSGNSTGIELFEYWHGIKKELRSRGAKVIVAKVPPFASLETRSKILNEFIEDKVKRKLIPISEDHEKSSSGKVKVNLIAHSMGGLDCRYLISKLEQENYEVVSLTTVSTPHRGTYAADYALLNVPSKFVAKFFPSINQLTLANAMKLNEEVKDDPKVKYFSYGSFFKPNPANFFYITWLIVNYKEGMNDGLVSLKSAKWGKYLGTLENVDHLDLINWLGTINRLKKVMGFKTFNPIAFYLDIANNLAKEGL
ncbi:hypothetical protein CANARDRAFT_7410 [[Candida] arabinofermentans NRRL YB-2248]|uniref:DUF676 domain-containing protein n=1 Tax=[Candida] arabinofermentans NRRL YB-2248 TaxID=983967 RepID=A0A1E4T2T1_9ASCO|nr:hypothetical protein CANARDRAFT_7410 [[Candida] arabinofermentans NRRL YB-2248]